MILLFCFFFGGVVESRGVPIEVDTVFREPNGQPIALGVGVVDSDHLFPGQYSNFAWSGNQSPYMRYPSVEGTRALSAIQARTQAAASNSIGTIRTSFTRPAAVRQTAPPSFARPNVPTRPVGNIPLPPSRVPHTNTRPILNVPSPEQPTREVDTPPPPPATPQRARDVLRIQQSLQGATFRRPSVVAYNPTYLPSYSSLPALFSPRYTTVPFVSYQAAHAPVLPVTSTSTTATANNTDTAVTTQATTTADSTGSTANSDTSFVPVYSPASSVYSMGIYGTYPYGTNSYSSQFSVGFVGQNPLSGTSGNIGSVERSQSMAAGSSIPRW